MARCSITMPDEFLLKCSQLADNTDAVLEKVLETGAELPFAQIKSGLAGAIGKTKYPSRTTGELIGALGISPVKISDSGESNIKIGFNEPRRKQYAAKGKRSYGAITNAMLANVLEHGKHGQPGKPFLRPAAARTKNAAIEAMKARLDSEVGDL